MDVLLIIIALAVMLAVFSFVLGFRRQRGSAMAERLQSFRVERQTGEASQPVGGGPLLKKRSYSGLPVLSAWVGRFAGTERVALQPPNPDNLD